MIVNPVRYGKGGAKVKRVTVKYQRYSTTNNYLYFIKDGELKYNTVSAYGKATIQMDADSPLISSAAGTTFPIVRIETGEVTYFEVGGEQVFIVRSETATIILS